MSASRGGAGVAHRDDRTRGIALTDIIENPTLPAATGPTFGLTKFADPLRVPPMIRPHSWWHQEEITVTAVATR
jgi:hypothetical protein